jgi:3-carboxy-cis,cis-muconate cycloisomerase
VNPESEEIFTGLFARGPVAELVSDPAFAQAMLDVEVALMRGLVRAGLAPEPAAEELARLAADPTLLDLAVLGRGTAKSGTPVPALLGALRGRLDPSGAAISHLHQGATSQDVVDTASMLVTKRALVPLLADLTVLTGSCAELANRHRDTGMPGRTLLQQGAPITFGLKAAQWLTGLDAARVQLVWLHDHELSVQLGGAVGTLAALRDRAFDVVATVAQELGLAVPVLPWHTVRIRPAQLACALGIALGAMAKVAQDVVLLAQTEVAEAREGGEGRGASSAMPHKRNPIGAVAIRACAQRSPGLVSTILAAMVQEHERAAGAWQAEWPTIAELLRLAGSAAATLRELLAGLELDPERMRANIVPEAMSEHVAAALAELIGPVRGREIVEHAARAAAEQRRPFRDLLLEAPEVEEHLGPDGLDRALAYEHHLGASTELIDRALAVHRDR